MQALTFLLILSAVVLIHEVGHFLAAKLFKVRVDEFGFGLPPKLFKLFSFKGTDFTVNALPIGGFVKLYGENGETQVGVPDERAFWAKKIWQRAIILLAGVMMNFVLAIFLFSIVYSVLGIPVKIKGVKVTEVVKDSPAAVVGLKVDDVIQYADNNKFLEFVAENKGKEIAIEVKRGEEVKKFKVTPRENPPEGEGSLGIVITDSELKHFPWYEMPFRGSWIGLQEAYAWGKEIAVNLFDLVWRLVTGKGISRDLAGPVGIYQISNQVRKQGILAILQFVGVLSVNLSILNIMPFPALDGGRLVFLGIELIRGKRIKEEIEGWVNTVGMLMLLSLMVLITINDLSRLGIFSGILGLFK